MREKKNLRQKSRQKNLSKKVSPFVVSTTTRKRKGEEEEDKEEEDALCDDDDDQNDDDDDDPAWHHPKPRARKTRLQVFEVVRVLEHNKCSEKDDDDGDHPFGAAKAYLDCREGNRDVERGDRDGEDFFHGRNVERG